ncbi:MAG: hypothetical protein CGU28_12180 [Candidatus Dactylopiibacterium carminicum]|uniref:Uncharacterized protein n=1 Tax=Candidatus Dactylopiibacterium carminicum TaxID=857335 RepID=A0A272EQ28_9RHOO|nr:hypothetical protein [Candidatus Dactylopiibacterium carminicum]KAF7598399.1 hypothetical protein BGI27_13480 [Candidatus Dactylopiibacterium carminicum]PAS92146.1 MAG: hypothetical protein CGU29_12850 [Candidatus Dactylopiibacterium carminicum]PAS95573.1 MAG: hypothetical protein CGU28_12180 [Candidatus Dactylopiibacterium carminicum]PAS97564.1 MAG: hypothetical protein BSR46_13505 [Candidatus Dactylopiibacterium carminicum]
MNRRNELRELEKQVLQLRADQYRLGLRESIKELHGGNIGLVGDEKLNTTEDWLARAADLAGLVLPWRWQRWLRLGQMTWRIAQRVNALTRKPTQTPPSSV